MAPKRQPFEPEQRHLEALANPEESLSPSRRLARAQMIIGLLRTNAWKVLDEAVSIEVAAITEQLSTEKSIDEIRALQGKIQGVNILRKRVADFLEDGQAAQAELERPALERDPQEEG